MVPLPVPYPTTTEPSPDTPHAPLEKRPKGRSPSPIIPPALVQRMASKSEPGPDRLLPATACPSSEIASPWLPTVPPAGRYPSGSNVAVPAFTDAPRTHITTTTTETRRTPSAPHAD